MPTRFYVIAAVVLVPLLALLSLIPPLVVGAVEKPIGPEFVAPQTGLGDAARGEALYRSKCFGCHAPEANVGPAQSTVDFKVHYADEDTLAFVVRAGRQPMPAFSEQMLSEQQLADIIAYIRSLPAPIIKTFCPLWIFAFLRECSASSPPNGTAAASS